MRNLLEQAVQISSKEYMNLNNPIFKGQTSVDDDFMYWMVFENDGVLYKIHNTL